MEGWTGRMLTASQRSSLESATRRYQESLHLAEEYLAARGFSEHTANTSRLGVVEDPVTGDESFRGRLSIPFVTRSGVVDIRYRCLQPHDCRAVGCPKYLGKSGASLRLFHVEGFFHQEDYICIAEGELDTLILGQCGLPAVGLPGASSWRSHYARIFEDYSRTFVFADGDKAGRKVGQKLQEEISATVIEMPSGADVNSHYLEVGPDWFLEKVNG